MLPIIPSLWKGSHAEPPPTGLNPPRRLSTFADRMLSLATWAAIGLGISACGDHSQGSEQEDTQEDPGSKSSDDSHGHGSHDHLTGSATSSEDTTDTGFNPSKVGIAPPEPGPRDCSTLMSTGIEEGDIAPDVIVQNAQGQNIRLHDYCNHTVLLLCGVMS